MIAALFVLMVFITVLYGVVAELNGEKPSILRAIITGVLCLATMFTATLFGVLIERMGQKSTESQQVGEAGK